jgi:RND superfamily putative drug exporter
MGGIEHLVGGETAAAIDATAAMFDGLPKVGVVLLVVIAVVLLLALRSILLPVKAIVMVTLSLGASLGGLLLLTGTELGAKIIGADGPGDIHPIVPVTIVAITVALSTDYEVMLVSRIGEDYRRTGDNAASVVSGVGRTGGVITSAAVIMIAVFVGFALADLQPLKQLGVGLALAVLLDATVVRGVLVPAAMAVMGRANWWWPGGKSAAPVSRQAARRHRAQVVPPPPASCRGTDWNRWRSRSADRRAVFHIRDIQRRA